MTAEDLVRELTSLNGFSRKPVFHDINLDGERLTWPETVMVHETLIKGAIQQENSIILLSPTSFHNFLDIYTLNALFKLRHCSDRDKVLVITANTDFRPQFRKLGPPHGSRWSKREFPIGTIKHDGTYTEKTTSAVAEDAPPRVFFTRHLHHLPEVSIADEIGCVIYDETVNFKPERWERFQEWLDEHEIPTVAYALRDPLGPEFDSVSAEIPVWSWSPGLIEEIDANKPVISSDGGALTRADKVRNRLNTKVEGVSYDIHGLTEGPVVDQFNEFWEYIEQLQEANSKINDSTLGFAIRELKRTQSALANLVTSIRTADQSYSNEWQAKTFQDWLESLQFQYRQLQEAEAAGMAGTYNNAIHLFDNLVEDWPEYENQTLDNGDQSPTKRDELYRLLTGCLDDGESVIVLLRKQSDQQAFRIDLQERGGPVYEALEDRVHLETPDSLIDAPSVDRLVLYGPPDWDQRWVFRSAHASDVTVLAYEHQLSLLGFQVRELNDTLEQLTSSDLHRAAITAAAEDEKDISSSTTARVDFDVPSPGSDDVSGSEISEGYEVIEEYEPTSVDDIIQSIQERTYTPDEGSKGQSSRESGPVSAIRFELEENWQLHKLPSGKVRVVNSDKDGVIKKSAKNVQRGDTIVKIRRSEILRNQLYEMIKKEEDHRTVFKAELWRHRLQEALDETGDSLQQFIARLEDRGIDVDYSTFRDWYIGERRYTQNDEHMRIVAEEYGITGAIDNVEDIKEEARRLKTIYIQLIRALRSQAHKATESEAPEDIVISKEYDIRLSDFDLFDETGEHLVKSLTARDIERGVDVPRNHLNRLEKF